MPMLPSRHYTSDANAFLRDFIKQHPEVSRKQEEGMKLWWDHDADSVKTEREANQKNKESAQSSE